MEIHTTSGGASKLVTNLTPSRISENRVNVFLDDKFAFSLDISQIIDYKIKVGRRLTEKEVSDYQHASEFGKLYQRTLEWVLTRPRSIKETRDHLRLTRTKREIENRHRLENKARRAEMKENHEYEALKKCKLPTRPVAIYSDEDIENVISRLIAKNYLNDESFAKFYVENRCTKKGISERKLRQELMKKGISSELIELSFANSSRSEAEEIKKIIQKKRAKYDDTKLIQYLVRRGFEYELAQNLVHETDSQN